MLDVELEGRVARIDVRDMVRSGKHPKNEILQFINEAQVGTIVEIHLPHPGEPLVALLKSTGMNAIVNQLGPEHYRIMGVKY